MTETPATADAWRARFEAISQELRQAEQEVQRARFKAARLQDKLADCQRAWDQFAKSRVTYY